MRASSIPADHPVPLWQSPEWAAALHQIGRVAEVETLADAGQAMVVSRRFGPFGTLRFASRGPMWADGTTLAERVDALKSARLHIINANAPSDAMLRAAGYCQLVRPKNVALLPIAADEDAQIAQAHGKWRNAMRQGQRQKLWCTVERFHAPTHAWIFEKDRLQQRQKGFRTLPAMMVHAFDQANAACIDVCLTWKGTTAIAAMIFLRHGSMATYHIGWTSADGRAARAHHVMMIHATEHLRKKGVQIVDLGVHDPKAAPGLALFKRRAGAQVHQLGGTWARLPIAAPLIERLNPIA